MQSNTSGAQSSGHYRKSDSSTGFTVGTDFWTGAANTAVAWTFRKAPKFFDVVTWTGDGASARAITHNLGVAPGFIIVKRLDAASNWVCYHRGMPNPANRIFLQGNNGAELGNYWDIGVIDSSKFHVWNGADANSSGASYVAYVFAHDSSVDGLIQCGSYTGNGSASGSQINIGWEPQFVLVKRVDVSGSGWYVHDTARRFTVSGSNALEANSSASDADYGASISPNATGFAANTTQTGYNASGGVYIYVAIRRSNKPPTNGIQVYSAKQHSNAGVSPVSVTGVGFAPDLSITTNRNAGYGSLFNDRIRGNDKVLLPNSTNAETTGQSGTTLINFLMDGATYGTSGWVNGSSYEQYIHHFFRRASGFFDVVCYSGNGSIDRLINHSLASTPELLIVKNRSGAGNWVSAVHAGSSYGSDTYKGLFFNLTNPSSTGWGEISKTTIGLTATTFNVGVISNNSGVNVNGTGVDGIAYLFASLPGISKVGSYAGNGASQTINCGFATGARFILIKRTDAAGDWYVWDSVRGIVAANDPHLSLNTTAAEVTTDDSVDPEASGFIVNQVAATNINVSGASYIFLAIA